MEGWELDQLGGLGCDPWMWLLLGGEVSPLGTWRIGVLLNASGFGYLFLRTFCIFLLVQGTLH